MSEQQTGAAPVEPQHLVMQVHLSGGGSHAMLVRAADGRGVAERLTALRSGQRTTPKAVDVLGMDGAGREARLTCSLEHIVGLVLTESGPGRDGETDGGSGS